MLLAMDFISYRFRASADLLFYHSQLKNFLVPLISLHFGLLSKPPFTFFAGYDLQGLYIASTYVVALKLQVQKACRNYPGGVNTDKKFESC